MPEPTHAAGEPQTLQAFVERLARFAEREAIVAFSRDGLRRWSYAELLDRVRRLAYGLAEAGVGQGDPVALVAGNRPEWIMVALAALEAGAVVVTVDAQASEKTLAHILSDSGARLVFTTADRVDVVQKVSGGQTGPRIFLLDRNRGHPKSWLSLAEAPPRSLPEVAPDDPATLFYTSGTTGPPKGVPLSHGNLAFELNGIINARLVRAGDRVLLPLPLHHVYPYVMGMLGTLTQGLTLVLPQSLTGPQLLRALNEGQVSVMVGVPRLYSALYKGLMARIAERGNVIRGALTGTLSFCAWSRRRFGLTPGDWLLKPVRRQVGPQLRLLATGGSALDAELGWRLEGLGWRIATGYGLTETAPLLTLDSPESAHIGSVGRPVPGVRIRLDESAWPQGWAVAEGCRDKGEILARGPNVFAGYHHLPEATREAFTEEGWFRTGDLGYVDKEGYLYVLGRVSTLIVTESGENIQPEEVEEAYAQHPVIREIGILEKNRRLVAVIVPEPKLVTGEPERIDETVRNALHEQTRSLPSYYALSDYALTRDALPRTRLGKIRRHLLAQRYEEVKKHGAQGPLAGGPMPVEEMSGEDQSLLEQSTARATWDYLIRRYGDRRLTPDTHLQFDLGVDSLGWMDLTLAIGQRTGVELDEGVIGEVETVRDLLHAIVERGEAAGEVPQARPLEQPEALLTEKQKRWLEPLGPARALLARSLYALERWLMGAVFRLKVSGVENVGTDGPYLIAPNHVSYLDPFAVAAGLGYKRLRHTHWAGFTGAAFGNPLTRAISRLALAVPVDPRRGPVSSLALGAAVLKAKRNLIWFPEGRRSPTGELLPFRAGVGRLLEYFQVPVIPVVVQGSYEALPLEKKWPRFRPIQVRFGQPLTPAELEQAGEGSEPAERIADGLRKRIAAMQQGG